MLLWRSARENTDQLHDADARSIARLKLWARARSEVSEC